MIEEFDDREILGTQALKGAAAAVGSVTLREGEAHVYLDKYPTSTATILTPTQARKLARHLNRIARRIEDRNAA
jgi:hypothetical protein